MYSFIETRLFARLLLKYLSDDEYQQLQRFLMEDPQAGDVIPGTGGVRKLRWQAPGRGKRGGYRVIYFVKMEEGIVWFLTMYPKNLQDNIPAKALRRIREELEDA